MSTARDVMLPQGETPATQRGMAALRELVQALTSSGVFLLRSALANIIVPRTGQPSSLRWGDMNRVVLTADSDVHLPRIVPQLVGAPLYLVKLSSGSTLTLHPSGLGLQQRSRPLINGSATLSLTLTGLYVLMCDNQNWFATGGPP